MPYSLSLRDHDSTPIQVLAHTGFVTPEEMRRVYGELQKRGRVHGLGPVLVDLRRTDTFPDRAELFMFINNLHYEPRIASRVALVTPDEHKDSVDFLVLTAEGRGLVSKAFDTESNALDWLAHSGLHAMPQ